ncbi:MAG: GFA family protein [Candidatus Cloacimonetes bacterium]|nr:GFA family protein [Candidatus Cloacimonadota bacterium]
MHNGSCLCKAVIFTIDSPLSQIDACHCIECRKHSGHYFVSADISKSSINIEGTSNIKWFQSSNKVKRGFCKHCGSSLFWEPIHHDWTAVAMGSIDSPNQASIDKHIYVSEKGDYYDLCDGLPQKQKALE